MAETDDLLEAAWGLIANAGWDGSARTPGWQEAAIVWRDQYFTWFAAQPSDLARETPI